MSKSIAYAVYLSDSGNLAYKELYTYMEIQILGISEDEDIEGRKCYVVYGENLRIEDYT